MPGGQYAIQFGRSAHDVALSVSISAEEECLQKRIVYDKMTLIGDVIRHPVGAQFYEEHLDDIAQGIISTGVAGSIMGKNQGDCQLTKEQIRKMGKGLYTQPLDLLKFFMPEIPESTWDNLIEKLNQEV